MSGDCTNTLEMVPAGRQMDDGRVLWAGHGMQVGGVGGGNAWVCARYPALSSHRFSPQPAPEAPQGSTQGPLPPHAMTACTPHLHAMHHALTLTLTLTLIMRARSQEASQAAALEADVAARKVCVHVCVLVLLHCAEVASRKVYVHACVLVLLLCDDVAARKMYMHVLLLCARGGWSYNHPSRSA